jgi:hypothetical protein
MRQILTVRARSVRRIIAGESNEFVREIHTRMPVILPEEHHDSWLSGEAGKEILVPYPADRRKAWPIGSRVNSPKDNDAEIIVPVELNPCRRRKILRNCCDRAYRSPERDSKILSRWLRK